MTDIEDIVAFKQSRQADNIVFASEIDKENWSWSTFIPKPFFSYNTLQVCQTFIRRMIEHRVYDKTRFMKELKGNPSNIELYSAYAGMVKNNEIARDPNIEEILKTKRVRSASGILVFTIMLSARPHGQDFTCKWDCSFCPNPPDIGRSYLKDEPSVRRGYTLGWDTVLIIRNRFRSYMTTNNVNMFDKETVKGDFILQGGTWSSYPQSYREESMRDMYYACNTIYDDFETLRPRLSLKEELEINKYNIGIRVVGLSVETRPDTVNFALCKEMRQYGVTKVQLGVQSTFDSVLKANNRGHLYKHAQKATKILANAGFKIQIHLMPDMYMSNEEMDKQMFEHVFNDENLVFDHAKIYPCMVLEYTKLIELYRAGLYHPYAEGAEGKKRLMEVCLEMTRYLKEAKRYDVRIERVIRDFTSESIKGGCEHLSFGNELAEECERTNNECICVRCREIAHGNKKQKEAVLKIRSRKACEGTEYFISYESEDEKNLYGLLRLRIPDEESKIYFHELKGAGLIRELHVYNVAVGVGKKNEGRSSQHVGLGTKLVKEAEKITKSHGLNKIVVISGTGVCEYYEKKHGFVVDGLYWSKII